MRIALNLLCLIPGEVGGTSTYAKGLCEGLAKCIQNDEVFLYLNESARDLPLPNDARFHKVICEISGRHRFVRYCYEQLVLPLRLRRDRIDVVHSLGNVSPLLAPCSSVVTISDLYFKRFAKNISFARWAALRFFVPSSVRRCDQIITVSEFSRSELSGEYPWAKDKIEVIHLATGFISGLPEHVPGENAIRVSTPYFVAFSSKSPHKNLERLIEAYAELRDRKEIAHTLVIVGNHWQTPPVLQGVVFTGYLPQAEARLILGGATFLVFPSLYEGFGLPVLEAMAMGIPVTCSTAGSLPEVAGEAALYFAPTSLPEIQDALARMSLDPVLRDTLKANGYENLTRFSWQQTAEKTYRVLKRAVAVAPRNA